MSPSVDSFDGAKYKALADGLEISEISLQKILDLTYDFRIESEYYAKSYLRIEEALNKKSAEKLCSGLHTTITDGTHYTPDYVERGIPFLSALNVKKGYLDLDAGYKYVTPQQHAELSRRVLPRKNDVLLRKVGVGPRLACVVPDLPSEFSIFVSVALLRTDVDPYYLSTFINSKYGQAQLLRFNKGISQPDLHLEDIVRLRVPSFGEALCDAVRRMSLRAQNCLEEARRCYDAAEAAVSCAIPLGGVGTANTCIKSVSQSFARTGRLDAEYYQPKFDALLNVLGQYSTETLGGENGLVSIKKSIEPGSGAYRDEGIPFVRVSDVDKFGMADPSIRLLPSAVPNAERLYPRKDTILFSKDGSVGIAYKLEEDKEVVTSGALLHLTVRDRSRILPDYLTLVLNSPIVRLQAERDCNGAIIQHWTLSDINKVIIPVLDMEKQEGIADKVQASFRLRREAKIWIDRAVNTVEAAVETDESTALARLKEMRGMD